MALTVMLYSSHDKIPISLQFHHHTCTISCWVKWVGRGRKRLLLGWELWFPWSNQKYTFFMLLCVFLVPSWASGHRVFLSSKMYFCLLLEELDIPKGSISNIVIETRAVMELKWILTPYIIKKKSLDSCDSIYRTISRYNPYFKAQYSIAMGIPTYVNGECFYMILSVK